MISLALYGKIIGATLGAAVGDAMGAATEMRTTEQIVERFGGPVRDFVQPPEDTFARNNKPGQVTDDPGVHRAAQGQRGAGRRGSAKLERASDQRFGHEDFPIGLLNPGNLDQAIEDAVTTCLPTHNAHLSPVDAPSRRRSAKR